MEHAKKLIDRLYKTRSLQIDEYKYLIENLSDEIVEYAKAKAVKLREFYYGKDVYIRGLIEISNICKNDCFYCGIRKSNKLCSRYRLTKEDILGCCNEGYKLGFRTFVLQGGEDPYYDDKRLCEIIKSIK
jgi:biotin synthase